MEKSLSELGREYFDAAADIDRTIAKYRDQLSEAYRNRNYLKTYNIKRKLTVLYDQRCEVLTIAHKLSHYYEDRKEGKSA